MKFWDERDCKPFDGLYDNRDVECMNCKQNIACKLFAVRLGIINEEDLLGPHFKGAFDEEE